MVALNAAGIGLWDVIASAHRAGSLDSAIRNETLNGLAELSASLPALSAVAFNGASAFRIGAPLLAGTGLPLIRLPSSSPAYAALPFEAKRAQWLVLRDYL